MTVGIPSFNTLCQGCDDVLAIDYFFAKSLLEQASHHLAETNLNPAFELLLALSWAQRQGHSCLALDNISDSTLWQDAKNNKPGKHFADRTTLATLANTLIEALPHPSALVLEDDLLFTARAFNFERGLMQQLIKRLKHEPIGEHALTKLTDSETGVWKKLFPDTSDSQSINWQGIAVGLALYQPLLILSGGPGTGKTYTIARLLIALQAAADKPLRIGLAAPTGKAAQRLNESLNSSLQVFQQDSDLAPYLARMPDPASTIHRLLGLREGTVRATYNEQNPLPHDVLIIDESSMLDLALFARITRAVKPDCRLVFVGDAHQLPAVEAGNVLPMLMSKSVNQLSQEQQQWLSQLGYELSSSAVEPPGYCIELQQTHRFSQALGDFATSLKLTVNNRVGAQQAWERFVALSADPNSNFKWVDYEAINQQLAHWVSEYFVPIAEQVNVVDALSLVSRFRILTALKKGELGSINLNAIIEQKLKLALGVPVHQTFYHGRLVIVTRNAPALNLFNGDVGLVWQEGTQLNVYFESGKPGEFRVIGAQRFSDLDSVFAMSIHKSQGSEFEHVAVVLPASGGEPLLSNELVYTGVTRTKGVLSIVANAERFQASICNQSSRWSGIKPLDTDSLG